MQTGVYLIVCSSTQAIYVGSAARSFESRWYRHQRYLHRGKHSNKHLQAAWNKYGEEVFEFKVAEECLPENCISVEQKWLDVLKSEGMECYNICMKADSCFGIRRSEQTRKKISESVSLVQIGRKHSEETKQKIGAAHTGRKRSEQARRSISAAKVGQKYSESARRNMALAQLGKKHSEETKQKISVARRTAEILRALNTLSDTERKMLVECVKVD